MEKVTDNFGSLICFGDAKTGWLEYKYKDSQFRVIVSVGQQAIIERGNKVTVVTRTPDGFAAFSEKAA